MKPLLGQSLWACCLAALAAAPLSPARADEAGDASRPRPPESITMPEIPVRLAQRGDELQLETLCVDLADASGRSVILVGTTHLGEEGYYRQLQQILDACDLVLYEDMAGGTLGLAWQLQHKAADGSLTPHERDLLDQINRIDTDPASDENRKAAAHRLHRQTRVIDYGGPQFVWADLSYRELAERLRTCPPPPAYTPVPPVLPPLNGPLTPDRQARRALAAQLCEPNGARYVMKTPFMRERDRHCLSVFDAQSRDRRRTAILYGAMHLPHIVELLQQRGFRLRGLRWYKAFTL